MQPGHFLAGQDGQGNTYKLGWFSLAFKICAADNGGTYSLLEAIEPPGSSVGLHYHRHSSKTFIICEGKYDFQPGEKALKLGPGEILFVPPGVHHGFKSIGPEIGRQLIISAPRGIFERLIAEIAAAMTSKSDS